MSDSNLNRKEVVAELVSEMINRFHSLLFMDSYPWYLDSMLSTEEDRRELARRMVEKAFPLWPLPRDNSGTAFVYSTELLVYRLSLLYLESLSQEKVLDRHEEASFDRASNVVKEEVLQLID